MKVESIVIVGGGSSGWMAAAMLSKTFPNMQIGLIEDEQGPIGVGESTLCLLYTSPSPRDKRQSRMPSSA